MNNIASPKFALSGLKSLLSLSALLITSALITAPTSAQNNIGTLDDRCTAYDYFTNGGYGTYKVKAGTSTDDHDARMERFLSPKIYVNKGTYTFQARYNIVSANFSTIAQILNHDSNSADTNKPVSFINAFDRGTRWEIKCKEKTLTYINKNSASGEPSFVLRMETDGTQTRIYINGSYKLTYTHARIGQYSTMRYGCYHHGDGIGQIRVKDVSFTAPSSGSASRAATSSSPSGQAS